MAKNMYEKIIYPRKAGKKKKHLRFKQCLKASKTEYAIKLHQMK